LALPVWIDWMSHALKSLPVDEPVPPEGVVSVGGRWVYEEYASGGGVDSVGLQDKVPEPANVQERSSILDLFKR
jgi:penicillin-binding protein 1A